MAKYKETKHAASPANYSLNKYALNLAKKLSSDLRQIKSHINSCINNTNSNSLVPANYSLNIDALNLTAQELYRDLIKQHSKITSCINRNNRNNNTHNNIIHSSALISEQ